jgi:hypothetical protein
MIGFEVFLTLIVTRVLLPVGLLLLVGERVRHSEQRSWKNA